MRIRPFVTCLLLLLLVAPVRAQGADRETLFQVGTIDALMQGVYDGGITCGALRSRGDLGLGTFQGLDGEMLVLDGIVYQVRGDGSVSKAPDVLETPFAVVTQFDADSQQHLKDVTDLGDLERRIAETVAAKPNLIYAVKLQGVFTRVLTRSVDRQEKPYPPLKEALAGQHEFRFEQRRGTMVGFYLPQLMAGLNVPGLHIHFLTAEADGGGHVLDLQAESLELLLDATAFLQLQMPLDEPFQKAVLGGQANEELEKLERVAPAQ